MGRLKALALACLLYFGHAVLLGQPRLDLAGGPRFDFGEVYSGTTVSRDLTLRNTGTDTLTISDITAGCGCTGTLMSSDRIPPAGSGILSISFNSKKFDGAIEKVVTLNTNDTAHSHVRITFTANVIKSLAIEPEYIVFRTGVDSAASADLSITNIGSSPVRIVSATSSTPLLSITMTAGRIKPGEESVLTCRLAPRGEGLLNGTITITTDRPKIPTLTVRFFALAGKNSPSSGSSSRN